MGWCTCVSSWCHASRATFACNLPTRRPRETGCNPAVIYGSKAVIRGMKGSVEASKTCLNEPHCWPWMGISAWMGTHIEYVSLYGNADSGPVCGLLKIDGVNLLLDCGWDDDYDVELLNPIKEVGQLSSPPLSLHLMSIVTSSSLTWVWVRRSDYWHTRSMIVQRIKPISLQVLDTIDAVLISHPDPSHLGALPYLVGKLKLQVPVYGTVACHKMGQLFMYDQVLSRKQSSDFEVFSLDDIDAAFSLMRQLKYQQRAKLTGTISVLKGTGERLTQFFL